VSAAASSSTGLRADRTVRCCTHRFRSTNIEFSEYQQHDVHGTFAYPKTLLLDGALAAAHTMPCTVWHA
jgi:hypothetical protein